MDHGVTYCDKGHVWDRRWQAGCVWCEKAETEEREEIIKSLTQQQLELSQEKGLFLALSTTHARKMAGILTHALRLQHAHNEIEKDFLDFLREVRAASLDTDVSDLRRALT